MHTKVPEGKPIIELVNGALACNSIRVPPRPNGSILKVGFLQGCGFLIIITEGFVLIMELKNSQLHGMFVERLSPMFVNHLHHKISSPINNVSIIPICSHTICHEPFENGHTQTFLLNNYIQLPPPNALNFRVLGLHVINHNCHDLSIDRIVNIMGHGCPSLNTLYMIEHHPRILKIITRLDLLDEIKFGHNSISNILNK
jgi:hypothetical protein